MSMHCDDRTYPGCHRGTSTAQGMSRQDVMEAKRAAHAAIRALQNMSLMDQRKWLEQHRDADLLATVLPHLHPTAQLELIRDSEERVLARARALEQQRRHERKVGKRDRAAKFLGGILRPRGRRIAVQRVFREAAQVGISKRTLHRAKAGLGVKTARVGFGRGGYFCWYLP